MSLFSIAWYIPIPWKFKQNSCYNNFHGNSKLVVLGLSWRGWAWHDLDWIGLGYWVKSLRKVGVLKDDIITWVLVLWKRCSKREWPAVTSCCSGPLRLHLQFCIFSSDFLLTFSFDASYGSNLKHPSLTSTSLSTLTVTPALIMKWNQSDSTHPDPMRIKWIQLIPELDCGIREVLICGILNF